MESRELNADEASLPLDTMSTASLLNAMNNLDQQVPKAVALAIPSINLFVEKITVQLHAGAKLFYIGAGTSGRLGILDASELPPTFGVPFDWVVGLIAGGDTAIRKAVEFAEDHTEQGWKDLEKNGAKAGDVLLGIAASGNTPYVLAALKTAQLHGLITGCLVNNPKSPMLQCVDFPICVDTGPEFIRGSTRLKAGTAQKLVLNMISTVTMIRLGRVAGNRMVDMQLTNQKLWKRGCEMLMADFNLSETDAMELLKKFGSVRLAQNSLARKP